MYKTRGSSTQAEQPKNEKKKINKKERKIPYQFREPHTHTFYLIKLKLYDFFQRTHENTINSLAPSPDPHTQYVILLYK